MIVTISVLTKEGAISGLPTQIFNGEGLVILPSQGDDVRLPGMPSSATVAKRRFVYDTNGDLTIFITPTS